MIYILLIIVLILIIKKIFYPKSSTINYCDACIYGRSVISNQGDDICWECSTNNYEHYVHIDEYNYKEEL